MKLRFGIIGCGRIAQRHAEHINKQATLVAVCDIDREKANQLGTQYGARVYDNVYDFLHEKNQIDVVSSCSPNGLHAEHAIKALKAGYHVLCEKPMAISVSDCGEMIKAAEQANRRLFAIKQNR